MIFNVDGLKCLCLVGGWDCFRIILHFTLSKTIFIKNRELVSAFSLLVCCSQRWSLRGSSLVLLQPCRHVKKCCSSGKVAMTSAAPGECETVWDSVNLCLLQCDTWPALYLWCLKEIIVTFRTAKMGHSLLFTKITGNIGIILNRMTSHVVQVACEWNYYNYKGPLTQIAHIFSD